MTVERLTTLASEIDTLDLQIIDLLVARFQRSREIGGLKRAAGQAPYDPNRVSSQTAAFARSCAGRGLNETMGRQLISTLVAQAIVERIEAL